MAEKITFRSKRGGEAGGELAFPVAPERAPGVVLVQEWWGLNNHVRSLLARLAAEGFVALAPDLYHGKVARDPKEAERLMGALDFDQAIDEIAGAVEALSAHPRCSGNVGILGFCMGGALSFLAATRIPGLGAVVPFYGVPSNADYARVTAPILAHFATRDGWAKPELAEAIQQELEKHGKGMQLHLYEADHAFMNDTRPEVHSPECAKLAWSRSMAFLREQLA